MARKKDYHIWHSNSEVPEKDREILITENLAYDCSSRTFRGRFDGKNFLVGEIVIKKSDVLEWAYANQECVHGYIARDSTGDLCLYRSKPPRGKYTFDGVLFTIFPKTMFENQTWNDKPRKVKLIIETE